MMARFTDYMEETQSELRQNESHRDLGKQTVRKSLPLGYKVQTGPCTFKTPYVMGKGIKPQQREPESLLDFHKFQGKSDYQISVKGYIQTVVPSTKEDNHSLKVLAKAEY